MQYHLFILKTLSDFSVAEIDCNRLNQSQLSTREKTFLWMVLRTWWTNDSGSSTSHGSAIPEEESCLLQSCLYISNLIFKCWENTFHPESWRQGAQADFFVLFFTFLIFNTFLSLFFKLEYITASPQCVKFLLHNMNQLTVHTDPSLLSLPPHTASVYWLLNHAQSHQST